MGLTLVTPPAAEPVSLTEAKKNANIQISGDDTWLTSQIIMAREYAEAFLRRQLVTATWDYTLPAFPAEIIVPLPPLQSITSVKYLDADSAEQTVSSGDYETDIVTEPGRIRPVSTASWPSIGDDYNAVIVRFVAGYGAAAAVPDIIKMALLLRITFFYEARKGPKTPQEWAAFQEAEVNLLTPYRIMEF